MWRVCFTCITYVVFTDRLIIHLADHDVFASDSNLTAFYEVVYAGKYSGCGAQ